MSYIILFMFNRYIEALDGLAQLLESLSVLYGYRREGEEWLVT